jgi:hypothetical protein
MTVRKLIVTGTILLLVLGNALHAQNRLAPPNDPNAVVRPGQAEIVINAENADKDIAVWVDGVIVAHVPPKTREKIIVNNGNHRIEAADTTLSRGNWNIGSKKQITVNANSNCTVIGLTTRYGTLLNLTIQSTTALESVGAASPAVGAQPSTPASQPNGSARDGSSAFSLENAVIRAAQKMIDEIPSGATVAVISIATNDIEVADYVLGELAFLMVDAKKFRVVDRTSIDKVRAEQGFQISGDVDEDTARSIICVNLE